MLTSAPPPAAASTGANARAIARVAEVVRLHLGARSRHVGRGYKRCLQHRAGVVDHQRHVGAVASGRGDIAWVGDVQSHRHDAGVGHFDGAGITRTCIHFGGAGVEKYLREFLTQPAVSPGDQCRDAIDLSSQ